jgi:hypothetical protein
MVKSGTLIRLVLLPAAVLLTLAVFVPGVRGEGAPPGLTGGPLGNSNAIFSGEAQQNWAGNSMALAGDVNGDGYADLLVGAPGADSYQGRAYLYLGGQKGWQLGQGLGGADAIYTGEAASDEAGTSVAAGDVNGDGYADLLIGAPSHSSWRGRAYLVLGSANPGNLSLGAAGVVKFSGEADSDRAGISVACAGDVNGDGYADLLVGAAAYGGGQGRAYLVLGSSSLGSLSLSDASVVKYTGESGSNAGISVAGAGDVNGDGYADLLVGAQWASSGQGRAYLVLGGPSPSSHTLNSSGDVTYTGEVASDRAGYSVAGAGDVNDDGYADLLVGAPWYGTSPVEQGRAYLVLGSAAPSSLGLGDASVVKFTGEAMSNWAGISVAGAGDVNGDGYADLAVAAYGYDYGRGRIYLVYADYGAAGGGGGARYRVWRGTNAGALVAVGDSGVTVAYDTSGGGSVYVTRYQRSTCSGEIATNGLLWRVDNERGSTATARIMFKYNDTQIAGMTEANLKLWYRARPCQDWTQDTGAVLDAAHNRITSSLTTNVHLEYTLASSQPSPTLVQGGESAVQPVMPGKQDIALLAVLALAAGAIAWERRQRRKAA